MGTLRNFVTPLHARTRRDYLGRMQADKVRCMVKAKEYGHDYWDGDRRYGYGGYRYDGRWQTVAADLIATYALAEDARILDIGCGKGYLLYELRELLPRAQVVGFDLSAYAIQNAKPEIRQLLFVHDARKPFPFGDGVFDLAISINTLHNLEIFDLKNALTEMERVATRKYLCVESFRNEQELFNLQCWALTCESFFSKQSWCWLFDEFGYSGDYEFIYFE